MDPSNPHREGLTTLHHDWTMIPAGKLVERQTPITIDSRSSIEDACETLLQNNISAAPVYDKEKQTYVGMFDYADLMAFILILLKKTTPPQDQHTLDMKELIQRANNAQTVSVRLVSDLSGKDPFYTILAETRLGAVVSDFGTGIHRVAVMDSANHLVGILTQSSTLDFIMRHLGDFPKLQTVMQKSLREFGLDKSHVLSVNGNSTVLDALMTMSSNSVTSLAVLDDQGILLGNISMTDIQHVMKNLKSSWLWISCFQFVSKIRLTRGVETGEDQYPVLDVNSHSTFGYTLLKLQATKVHRLWVVNDLGAVVGVVSLTDAFRVLSSLIDN
ncbi:cell separation during budding [Podila epigama]|nr:cell separation during budding [Podila epigama]